MKIKHLFIALLLLALFYPMNLYANYSNSRSYSGTRIGIVSRPLSKGIAIGDSIRSLRAKIDPGKIKIFPFTSRKKCLSPHKGEKRKYILLSPEKKDSSDKLFRKYPKKNSYELLSPHHQKVEKILKPVIAKGKGYISHKVQLGDAVSIIARRYGVEESQIQKLNNLRDINHIKAGQVLRISSRDSSAEYAKINTMKNVTYKVVHGDSLTKISRRFGGVSVNLIAQVNGIRRKNHIRPGQKFIIPKVQSHTESELTNIITTIARGRNFPHQTLLALAWQESIFGKELVGDNGKSHGVFHIYSSFHTDKGATPEKALDIYWATNFSIDYLVELGYHRNPRIALRRWNGGAENPRTLKHFNNVARIALEKYGYRIV